LKRWYL